MKPTRMLLCLAILALAPLAAGCTAPAPTPTAAPAVVTQPSATAAPPTATAAPPTPTAPPVTATPVPAQPGPTPLQQTGLYIQPEQLWAIQAPPMLSRIEARDERLTVFSGAEPGTVLVVDSYLGTPDDYGNTGEGLRNRARDVIHRFYGASLSYEILQPDYPRWDADITFERSGVVKGEAFYVAPGRQSGDYRIYGVLLAYPPEREATARPLLEAARRGLMAMTPLELQVPAGSESLWVLYSSGLRSFDPNVAGQHFLAVFARTAAGWQERAHIALPAPDYVDAGSVAQVQVEPTRLWLVVEGGVGAHGGTFDLVSYAAGALKVEAEGTNSTPGAGAMQDLDGDGILDVVLDQTYAYVFCYACSVRNPAYQVLRWDGAKFVEVQLAALGDSAPAGLRDPVNRAVELAQAGLWKDAQTAALQVPETSDAAARWDLALIRLHADAFAELAADPEGPYPLLQRVFYGDYAAAIDVVRPYTPQEIFDRAGPLIAGTVAEGWEAELASSVSQAAESALEAEPDLAAAYFLRGWATYLVDPAAPSMLPDVQRAAELAPEEPLYAQALAYLRERAPEDTLF